MEILQSADPTVLAAAGAVLLVGPMLAMCCGRSKAPGKNAKKNKKKRNKKKNKKAANAAAAASADAPADGSKKKKKKKKKGKATTEAAKAATGSDATSDAAAAPDKPKKKNKKKSRAALEEEKRKAEEAAARKQREAKKQAAVEARLRERQKAETQRLLQLEIAKAQRQAMQKQRQKQQREQQRLRQQANASSSTAVQGTHVSMRVNPRYFGALIGPGGATLKLLQDGSGTRITIPPRDSPHTNVVIEGPAAGIRKARDAINQLVNEGYSSLTHPDCYSLKIAIPEHRTGVVIGPGGCNLKRFQAMQVNVKIPNASAADARATIVGEKEAVVKVRNAIRQLATYGYSSVTHPGCQHQVVPFPQEKLSMLIGPHGSTIRMIKGDTKTNIDVGKQVDRDGNVKVLLVGQPTGLAQAEKRILRIAQKEMAVRQRTYDDDAPTTRDLGGPDIDENDAAIDPSLAGYMYSSARRAADDQAQMDAWGAAEAANGDAEEEEDNDDDAAGVWK